MEWLLVLTLIGPVPDGIGRTDQPAGLMVNHQACIVAGAGMKIVLQAANPGVTVAWSCLPPVGKAVS